MRNTRAGANDVDRLGGWQPWNGEAGGSRTATVEDRYEWERARNGNWAIGAKAKHQKDLVLENMGTAYGVEALHLPIASHSYS